MSDLDDAAMDLIERHGFAAPAYAAARALECLYYCDDRGQVYWQSLYRKIRMAGGDQDRSVASDCHGSRRTA